MFWLTHLFKPLYKKKPYHTKFIKNWTKFVIDSEENLFNRQVPITNILWLTSLLKVRIK